MRQGFSSPRLVERRWAWNANGQAMPADLMRISAGIRTFALLGLLAGLAGWLWSVGVHTLAAVLLAGTGMLIVAAYFAASRSEVDGTTEVAAFVVLAAGTIAGMHELRLASATIAITTLLLLEKQNSIAS